MAKAKKSVAKNRKPAAKNKRVAKQPVAKKPAAKKKTAAGSLEATLSAIEAYFAAVKAKKILELHSETVEPQSAKQIATIEKTFAVKLPDDIKVYLARGFKAMGGAKDDDEDGEFGSIGFDFLDVDGIIKTTTMMRDIAKDFPDDSQQQIAAGAIALTYSEPQIILAADGSIHHWHGSNDKCVVAKSFTDFMSSWAGAGCHSSHSFDSLWPLVKTLAPKTVALEDNLWLKAYKKQFPESVTMKL